MSEPIRGTRHDRPDGSIFEPGEYGKGSDGRWYCCPPGTDALGNLSAHTVVEHADGTITVTPSILLHPGGGEPAWHGFLTAGVWSVA